MGHLLLDGVFDEEKYERGVIKLLRAPAEEDQLEVFKSHSIHKRHHHWIDKDTMNCPRKVMKISHLNQTN